MIKNFGIWGGDFENNNGSGGKSIYGYTFDDENFTIEHANRGLLTMVNRGKDTNGSQFFITLGPVPSFDNKNVVFGTIVMNMDFLDVMEQVETGENCRPIQDIIIVDCGEIKRE